MKKPFFIFFLLTMSLNISAQSGVIKVSNGKVVQGELFLKNQYVLENFLDAKITLKDGTVYENKANINTVSQTLRIIEKNGDTLSVNVEKMIKAVRVSSALFYKINDLYIRVLETNGKISLGQSKVIRIGEVVKKGAYGWNQETASITNVDALSYNGKLERLAGEVTLMYNYREDLFLIKEGKLYTITKKNLAKLFPNQSKLIETFIENNNINLNQNSDIRALFSYIINS